jgi:catechol 2,3-dioxygenase-like lactoylglutathione lyase family enzyme
MQFTQIKETCLYVKNLRKTMSFYQDALGLEMISYVKDSHIFFRVGHSVLLCFLEKQVREQDVRPPHFASGVIHLAFEAPEGEYEHLRKEIVDQDIEIIHDHLWEKGHRSFYFKDPDGHLLEVVEPGMWDH